jgi:hypothetical protein
MFTQRGIIGHLKFYRPQKTIDDPDATLLTSLEDQSIRLVLTDAIYISEDEPISDDPASSQSSGHTAAPFESNSDHTGAPLDDIMDEDIDIDALDIPAMVEDEEDEGEW